MLLESAIEVQQDKPPRRILPVDFSSNAASTPTNETSRGIDTKNDISFLPSTRKIPPISAQPSQIDRNQLTYDSRFQHEPYVTALLNIAEQTFSGPALRTTAARSFTTSSQVPNDKQVSLPQSGPVDTGEPPVRPHPNVQLNDSFRVEKIMAGATRRDVVIQDGFSTFASIPDLDLNAPEARQYASSNTMPLVAPCMVSARPNVQANTNWVKSHNFMDIVHSPDQNSALLPEYPKPPPRELEPNVQAHANWVKSHNFMDIVHSPEQHSALLPESPKPPPRGLEPPVNGSQDPWADYVPSPIPEEVQALINAYICGRPFNLFVARSRLYDYWNLSLPEEFGYVMLGFFRVLSVQVRLLFLFVG
jgi:hypothetical protein